MLCCALRNHNIYTPFLSTETFFQWTQWYINE